MGANQHAVVDAISATLGKATDTSVSNTMEAQWRQGDLVLTARSFPPELQRAGGRNDLHDRAPELSRCTTVHIETVFPAYRVSEHLPATISRSRSIAIPDEYCPVPNAQLLRRHGPLDRRHLRLWADDAAIGVSASATSAVTQRQDGDRLVLEELTPARGGGSASLRISRREARSLEIARSSQHGALRSLAAQAAEITGLAAETEQQPDE
ncbi:MAG: hypothetical protein ACI9C1_002587 [Candidatus Aldehydirespiratoraceae bacterium]